MRWVAVITVCLSLLTGCAGRQPVYASQPKASEKTQVAVQSPRPLNATQPQSDEKIIAEAESPPRVKPAAPKPMDLGKFSVEVEGLQIYRDGSVVVILGYESKIKPDDRLLVRIGFKRPAAEFTLLFDDAGNTYKLSKVVGSSDSDKSAEWTSLFAGSRAAITLVFQLTNKAEKAPRAFTVTSAQNSEFTLSGYETIRYVHNIVFRDIEPR